MLMFIEVAYNRHDENSRFHIIEEKPMIVEDFYNRFPSYVGVKNNTHADRRCDLVTEWHECTNGTDYKYALMSAEKYSSLTNEQRLWAVVENR